MTVLAASDPANAYGAILRWPAAQADNVQLQRGGGARVLLRDGELIGYLSRTGHHLITFAAEDPADQDAWNEALAEALADMARKDRAVLVSQINGEEAGQSPLAGELLRRGFSPTSRGLLHRGRAPAEGSAAHA